MNKLILYTLLVSEFLFSAELITPIPTSLDVNQEKATLGKELFFETKLSKNNTVSCANCHQLFSGGDDNLVVSTGINGAQGSINAPTVYNAVFNFRQFWDGRAKTLKEQAMGPVENPIEMGHNFEALIPELNQTNYKAKFDAIYEDGITKENIADAIAEFEKTLITPNSPFDRYLKGDQTALTQKQKDGYEIFKAKGCIACHHGVNIGGNTYNKFGIFSDSNSSDLGRYNITHRERDKYYFKVPSLRNIEKTAPYFHDGRTDDLRRAVLLMAKYQLGRKITQEEIDKIVAFLKSLNGELPQDIEP
ncbi:cytochrome-c peroxidase [Sulfurimonas marina]|uniref:Cytochrome-c peroxidase n=1 Tax=Sulfurimonas marina TaxID=2590551 RepID=A0A7M1AUW3_9BACT|nr:cytochrome-c peroxidase [Sulfurimonas marina]QOP41214.1 cytochrome-c peroxidase [Sulfurimonas marina]